MYRLNPDCWVWSPRPRLRLVPQQQRRFTSTRPGNQEEEEEEEVEDHSAVCCYTTGCDGIIAEAADAHWSTLELAAHSGIPNSSVLAGQGPQQPITVLHHAAGGDTAQHASGSRCCQGPGTEIQACGCVYGQRGPEGLGHCWPGSPYVYYGVRRNVVVGVEVVEEVAVEDTLEVITEHIYTDDLLDPDLLQDDQLYPT
ncbi:uncharacterized protein LOC122881178 isoform X1 [Scomber scombrus]|uniref:Uncharacterized protein LOC122881178 isoform X1 n=1 Tax=Scomber scombrus TaxID=13677 RepID=A0AAV1PSM7_SCOSC